jgi:hypothetical protein
MSNVKMQSSKEFQMTKYQNVSANPDLRYGLCERSEAISVFRDEIATHLLGARNDPWAKAFYFLNRDLAFFSTLAFL